MAHFIDKISKAQATRSERSHEADGHYENMPMQHSEIFKVVKNENFQSKNFDIFLTFAPKLDCGYTLELPRRDGFNEYPHSMFCIPLHTPVFLYKSGVQGGILFMDMFS